MNKIIYLTLYINKIIIQSSDKIIDDTLIIY
uniref:Uncharacterized protein n=1 Tax=Moumouvirus sp. 'Monve' TaxID=1128131 RepID=H2EG22_9VIRU|nr:hypothetical protein mv_L1143 [Moumouvirus Monve]